jgi:D-tyrosyl-tRNA(Tyr) deacylase
VRAVVQRVKSASVSVDNQVFGKIGKGLLVFLGIGQDDDEKDIEYLAGKIVNLRVFEDSQGKMNLSLLETGCQLLVISQFTLYGDCRKGRRPSYDKAARPEVAKTLYEEFIRYCNDNYNLKVETGVFQEEMMVDLVNDGPVTLLLDSKKNF